MKVNTRFSVVLLRRRVNPCSLFFHRGGQSWNSPLFLTTKSYQNKTRAHCAHIVSRMILRMGSILHSVGTFLVKTAKTWVRKYHQAGNSYVPISRAVCLSSVNRVWRPLISIQKFLDTYEDRVAAFTTPGQPKRHVELTLGGKTRFFYFVRLAGSYIFSHFKHSGRSHPQNRDIQSQTLYSPTMYPLRTSMTAIQLSNPDKIRPPRSLTSIAPPLPERRRNRKRHFIKQTPSSILPPTAEPEKSLIAEAINQQQSSSHSPDPEYDVIDLKSFQDHQTITVTGTQVTFWYFGSQQVKNVSRYSKTIPIAELPGYFFINQAYHAHLATVRSNDELPRLHTLHRSCLRLLYERIERERQAARNKWKALMKPVPKMMADKEILERRHESIAHEESSLYTRPVGVQWKWSHFSGEAETKMLKLGVNSRKNWAWVIGLTSLLEEIEERIGKVDKEWVYIERRQRPLLKRKEKRWVKGKRGWTGLTTDDIADVEEGQGEIEEVVKMMETMSVDLTPDEPDMREATNRVYDWIAEAFV